MDLNETIEQYKKYALQLYEPWPGMEKNEEYKKRWQEAEDKIVSFNQYFKSSGNIKELEELLKFQDARVQVTAAIGLVDLGLESEYALYVLDYLQYERGFIGTNCQQTLLKYKKLKDIFLKDEEVKEVIRKAFKDVQKGEGIGIREANEIDNYNEAGRVEARKEDSNENWWDIPPEIRRLGSLALCYTDKEGFKFVLPAAMFSEINDESIDGQTDSHLIHYPPPPKTHPIPFYGSKEYVSYLRGILPKEIIDYYGFNQEQVHAIALFLLWEMQQNNGYLLANREKHLEWLKEKVEMYSHPNDTSKWVYTIPPKPGDKMPQYQYDLSLQDEIAIFDEECRIMREWLELGNVDYKEKKLNHA